MDDASWSSDDVLVLFDDVVDLAKDERLGIYAGRTVPQEVIDQIEALVAADKAESLPLTEVMARSGQDHGVGGPEHPDLEQEAFDQLLGQKIGPYRFKKFLGAGGFGSVFLGSHSLEDFHQEVAIKILKTEYAGRSLRDRFKQERRLLSKFIHPNIARFLDGGTTDDFRLYFVMEYVEGEPIDRYCDRRKLSIHQRLNLFCEVASAVQVVHGQAVIHRDIKASNVLVTEEGVPKLLDFGIAKTVAQTNESQGRPGPLTLSAASPEQIQGKALTTATDIYSLGLMLYLMLSGKRAYEIPHDGRPAEIREVICERPAEPPSSRGGQRELRGDLDAILLKALAKEPEDRYDSVAQLIEDIRRYQRHEPVMARDGGLGYVLGKLARRHWVPLSSLVLAFLVILALSVAFTLEVQQERDRALAMKGLLQDILQSADPNVYQGDDVTLGPIIDQASRSLPDLDEDPRSQAELMGVLGDVYMSLGRHEEALELLETSLDIRRTLYPGGHFEVVEGLQRLGRLALQQGDFETARAHLESGLELSGPLGGKALRSVADIHQDLAEVRLWEKDPKASRQHAHRATTLRQELQAGTVPTSREALEQAESLELMASVEYFDDRPEVAERLFIDALSFLRANGIEEHHVTATLWNNLAHALRKQGRLDEAQEAMAEAIEIDRKLLGEKSLRLAIRLLGMGNLYRRQGLPQEALDTCRQALDMTLELRGEQHPNVPRIRTCIQRAEDALKE